MAAEVSLNKEIYFEQLVPSVYPFTNWR